MFRRHVSVSVSPGLYTTLSTNMFRRHVSVSVSPGLYTTLSTHVFRRHVSVSISPAQQTTTRDFTCSVSEFTSSTGSIHVFSVREFTGFCRQIWCVDTCLLLVKSRVFPFVKNTCFLHVYSPDCRT